MGRLCRTALALGTTVALVAAVPARAADVAPSGQVVVRWQSNPATCAGSGLCGRSGTLVWRPSGLGAGFDLSSGFSFFGLVQGSPVARSVRDTAEGPSVCIESPTGPDFLGLDPAPGHRVVVRFEDPSALGFGRCAGPLAADFASALPASKPVLRAALAHGTRVDMSGHAPFSAGPFTGSVDSTLVLRTRRERSEDTISTSGNAIPNLPRGPTERIGSLGLRYAVDSVEGDAGFGYGGVPSPACEPFDSCGLSGDLDFEADGHGGVLVVNSYRRLPGHANETRAGALRALHSGKSSISVNDFLGTIGPDGEYTGVPVALSERAGFAGTPPCADTSSLSVDSLSEHRTGTGIRFALIQQNNATPDHVRTRCPGPAAADLARDAALAAGSIPYSAFGEAAPPLVLRPAAAFRAFGYMGAGRGQIAVTLRLIGETVRTHVVRKPRETL